jgi:hypothetical protein
MMPILRDLSGMILRTLYVSIVPNLALQFSNANYSFMQIQDRGIASELYFRIREGEQSSDRYPLFPSP